jgi:TPR repeat protein
MAAVAAAATASSLLNTANVERRQQPPIPRNVENDPSISYNRGCFLAEQGKYEEANDFFRKAHALGYSSSTVNLAISYEFGRGEKKNIQKAIALYEVAANAGDDTALFSLAKLTKNALGDVDEAVRLFTIAAANGHVLSMYNLGLYYERSDDVQMATQFYEQSFNLGHTPSAVNLGVLLKDSTWFEKAAAASGDAGAYYNLGVLSTEAGREEEAVDYYQKSSEKNHAKAMYNLSQCKIQGKGCEINESEALALLERAADEGDTRASKGLRVYEKRKRQTEKNEALRIEEADEAAKLALVAEAVAAEEAARLAEIAAAEEAEINFQAEESARIAADIASRAAVEEIAKLEAALAVPVAPESPRPLPGKPTNTAKERARAASKKRKEKLALEQSMKGMSINNDDDSAKNSKLEPSDSSGWIDLAAADE